MIPTGIPSFKIKEPSNTTFRTIIPASGIAQCPAFMVPPGAQVRVRGHNGAAAGNVAPVIVATTSGTEAIAPNTEVIFPVTNTAQITVTGTAGDGIQVSMKG